MFVGKGSPWGIVQDEELLADGIILVTTASHGGIWVSAELLGRVPKVMRDYASYWSGSPHWFEEDCAAQCVVVSFPEYFGTEQVERARVIVDRYVLKVAA